MSEGQALAHGRPELHGKPLVLESPAKAQQNEHICGRALSAVNSDSFPDRFIVLDVTSRRAKFCHELVQPVIH